MRLSWLAVVKHQRVRVLVSPFVKRDSDQKQAGARQCDELEENTAAELDPVCSHWTVEVTPGWRIKIKGICRNT